MKRIYLEPVTRVITIQQQSIICGSKDGWDSLTPDNPNEPAGSRQFDDWDDMEDDELRRGWDDDEDC